MLIGLDRRVSQPGLGTKIKVWGMESGGRLD